MRRSHLIFTSGWRCLWTEREREPKHDSGVLGALDRIMEIVNARLAASLTANTRGGVFYGFESKPVGKAD